MPRGRSFSLTSRFIPARPHHSANPAVAATGCTARTWLGSRPRRSDPARCRMGTRRSRTHDARSGLEGYPSWVWGIVWRGGEAGAGGMVGADRGCRGIFEDRKEVGGVGKHGAAFRGERGRSVTP